MKKLIQSIQQADAWFNNNFGWFFTNGNKVTSRPQQLRH